MIRPGRRRIIGTQPPGSLGGRSEGAPMETAIGIVLILISLFLIVAIVRTVQANLPRA